MMFWSRKKKPAEQAIEEVQKEPLPEVTAVDARDDDAPEMKRCYIAPLTNGRKLEITFKSNYWNPKRDTTGFVYQADGNWMIFRVDAIAQSILDPELVPQVEKYVDEMIRLDVEYMASDPKSYVDRNGVRWSKVTN